MSPSAITPIKKDVIIVGAGFGGCYLLHLLRQNGFSVKVVEAADCLGGVWAHNRYPGARVDCEVPYYGFSDPAIWDTWTWTERFPSDDQLRAYFQHVDDVWHLSNDVYFDTRISKATFHEAKNGEEPYWLLEDSSGQTYQCKWLLAATGTSFKHYVPEWKGLDKFKGPIHHSSKWPKAGIDMTGKCVAVIGAGSTAVQVVQEAAKVASHVTEFIKSPNLALPMRQRQITEEEIYNYKPQYRHVFAACRTTNAGLPFGSTGKKTFDVNAEERNALWEELWKRGGFNFSIGGFTDTILSPEANQEAYEFWAAKVRARIKDPKKRELLAPSKPPYAIGTKRPSLEQDYYECCDQPNVEITNSPILEFTESGIKTEEKLTEFDVVAVCTGYDAVTGGLRTMGIKGRDGLDLDEKWRDGVITHLGMSVNGFPNMYMIYGPQAPTSLTNGPPFLEIQCEWVVDALKKQRDEEVATVEAKKEEEEAWRKQCLDIANMTLATQTKSWWMGANVPGKKPEFLLYMGGLPAWQSACNKALDGWHGFDVNHGPGKASQV